MAVTNERLPGGAPRPTEDKGGGQGKGKGKDRRKPFAVEQADRDVAAAKQVLDEAKETGPADGKAVRDAQKAYDEAVAARDALRGDTREERREARQEFMQDYYNELGPYVAQLVKEDPALRQFIQDAISNGWNRSTFERELKLTDWWQDEGKTNAWLEAFKAEFGDDPGGQWAETLGDASDVVLDFAARYGVTLPDDVVERIARRSIYEGWDEREFQEWMAARVRRDLRMLDRYNENRELEGLTGEAYQPGGTVESRARALRNLAQDYGLTYGDNWFIRRAVDIMDPSKRFTEEDVINQMVAEAEQLYPVFQGRLSADYTLRDAAGSYIGQMANLLELPDQSQISLKDPLLSKAFNSVMDDKGNPQLMSLWDFTKEVRKDPRWDKTANAFQTYSTIGTGLARAMGFLG